MNDVTKSHGLWHETAISTPVTKQLSGNISVDVAVIGGGITGLSSALHLAAQGVNVAVLEAKTIGFGGSGRNVGLVNPGMWVRPDDICSELGQQTGERLIEVLGEAPNLVFDIINRYQISCEAVRHGTLHCAVGRNGLREIEERAAQWLRRGAPVRLLDRKETERRVGSSMFSGALLDDRAGTIQPLSYVRGLADAAMTEGARIFTDSEVKSADRSAAGWTLTLETGSVTAKWIVVSTNAYSGSLWPALREEIIPLSYFQCATAPIPAAARAAILSGGEGMICTRSVITSLRTDAAGRLLFGSLGALRNVGNHVHEEYSRRMLRRMFPGLGDVRFEYKWFGTIAMTQSHLPRYHELDHQVLSFHGYNGRGIGTGTMFGKIMAERILNPRYEMPLPAVTPDKPGLRSLRSGFYEAGSVVAHLI